MPTSIARSWPLPVSLNYRCDKAFGTSECPGCLYLGYRIIVVVCLRTQIVIVRERCSQISRIAVAPIDEQAIELRLHKLVAPLPPLSLKPFHLECKDGGLKARVVRPVG